MNPTTRSVLFILFTNPFAQLTVAQDYSDLYQKSKRCVVTIFSNGGLCAGFYIDEKTIATAWHCVKSLRVVEIDKAGDNQYFSVAVIAKNSKADIALLDAGKNSNATYCPIRNESEKLKVGERIFSLGHPNAIKFSPLIIGDISDEAVNKDLTYVFSSGIVSKVNENYFYSDIKLSQGFSGGPIIDEKGAVVGMVSGKFVASDFAILARHEQILSLNKEANTNNSIREALPFFKAALRPSISYFSTFDRYESKGKKFRASGDGWEIGIAIWDRLTLNYGYENYTNVAGYYHSLGLGYKWLFIPTRNNPFAINPIFYKKQYQIGDEKSSLYALGVRFWLLHSIFLEAGVAKFDHHPLTELKSTTTLGIELLSLF